VRQTRDTDIGEINVNILSRSTALLLLWLALVLVACPSAKSLTNDTTARPKVGVIPFVNFTGSNEAADSVLPMINKQLADRNIELVSRDSLRSVMRARRIRMTGAIDTRSAAQLHETLGIDLLLTGSIDFYSKDDNPEVGLSLRLYDCAQQRLIWTNSVAASGEDYAGLFGIGRITSAPILADRVVDKIFDRFPFGKDGTLAINLIDYSMKAGARIAIVTLDNLTEQQRSGDIASILLLSELSRQGYEVVEPGEVAATMAELRSLPRGQVSIEEVARLRERLQVDLVVTGTIYRFSPGSGRSSDSPPQVEMGLRMISAIDGKVLASVSSVRVGDDSEGPFGIGRCYSLGKLTQESFTKSWQQLLKQRERRLTIVMQSKLDGEQ
jgi:TolB-like protein